MAFQRGAQAAEAVLAESKFSSDFEKVEFLTQILKKENDQVVLRFVHDGHEWYFSQTHFEATKPADPSWDEEAKKRWPSRMPATCRHDKNIGEEDCYWCDAAHTFVPNPDTKDYKRAEQRGKYFPRLKYIIPAVVRIPIKVTQEMIDSGEVPPTKMIRGEEHSMLNMVIGYEDELVEVDEKDADGKSTGNKIMRPRVILCNQSHENFVAGLQADWESACADGGSGTILDRDYRCKRTGEGFQVKYALSAMPITPNHDLSDPETKARYDFIDIEKMIVEQASDEYYAKFFDRRVARPGEEKQDGIDVAAREDEGEPAFASRQTDQDAEAAKEAIRQSMGKKSAAAQPVG